MDKSDNISPGRIARNTLMLYVRMLLVSGVGLFTSRLVLSQLGVVDYGIFNVVGGIIIVLSFLNGAMSQSTQRFLSFELARGDENRLLKTFRTTLTIHFIIGCGLLIVAETLGLWFLNSKMIIPPSQLSGANWVFQCSVATFIFSILKVPYNGAIIAHERMQFFAWFSVLEVCMKLAVAFSLSIFTGEKLKYYALLLLGVNIAITLGYCIYSSIHFAECKKPLFQFKREYLFPMVGFASWTTIGSLSWVARTQGCNIILNLFFGPVINASYGISNHLNAAVYGFVQNFNVAIGPQIFKSYSVSDFSRMQKLINYGCKLSFFLMIVISFPLIMLSEPLIYLWLGKIPDYIVVFTRLILIYSLIDSFSHNISIGIKATGKIAIFELLIGGTNLLILPVSYFMLKHGFPPTTVYTLSICIAIIALIEKIILLRSVLPMFSISRFLLYTFVPVIRVSFACLLLFFAFCHVSPDANIFVNLCGSVIAGILTIIIIGLNSEERKYLYTFAKMKWKFVAITFNCKPQKND